MEDCTVFDTAFWLVLAATAFSGVLAGASLDQSIKQLPARHPIGVVAYSAYSRAGDLGNGIAWYASIGVSAALLSIAAAVVTFFQQAGAHAPASVYVAAVLSMLHTLVTARAAPTLMSQKRHVGDEAALTAIFNRFARLQALRALLQALTFGALLVALVGWGR